jgi:hypothetical protein
MQCQVELETEAYCIRIETGQIIAMTMDIGWPIFKEPGDYRV